MHPLEIMRMVGPIPEITMPSASLILRRELALAIEQRTQVARVEVLLPRVFSLPPSDRLGEVSYVQFERDPEMWLRRFEVSNAFKPGVRGFDELLVPHEARLSEVELCGWSTVMADSDEWNPEIPVRVLAKYGVIDCSKGIVFRDDLFALISPAINQKFFEVRGPFQAL